MSWLSPIYGRRAVVESAFLDGSKSSHDESSCLFGQHWVFQGTGCIHYPRHKQIHGVEEAEHQPNRGPPVELPELASSHAILEDAVERTSYAAQSHFFGPLTKDSHEIEVLHQDVHERMLTYHRGVEVQQRVQAAERIQVWGQAGFPGIGVLIDYGLHQLRQEVLLVPEQIVEGALAHGGRATDVFDGRFLVAKPIEQRFGSFEETTIRGETPPQREKTFKTACKGL